MAAMGSTDSVITVRIPLAVRKRGGRKLVIAPDGTETGVPLRRRVDNAMVKAIARGFRWRKLLENGTHATVEEIAAAEKINASYVGRVLRLTLLAPEIVEAILDGRQPAEMTLAVLMKPFPVGWEEQHTVPSRNSTPPERSAASAPAKSAPALARAPTPPDAT